MRDIEDIINLTDGDSDPMIDRMEKDIDRLMRQVESLSDQNRRLLDSLKMTCDLAEYGRVVAAPGHFCGPEGNCDCICVEATRDAETICDARCLIAECEKEDSQCQP